MFVRAGHRFLCTVSQMRSTYCVYRHACRLWRTRPISTHQTSSQYITRLLARTGLIGLGGLCAIPVHNAQEAGVKGLPDIELLMGKVEKHRQFEKMGYHSDDLWEEVIEARVNIDDRRHEIQALEAILNSALLTLEAASEAAFQSGNEELAMMGRDRCQYVNTQIALTTAVILKAEKVLAKFQADAIKETKTEKKEEGGDEDKGTGKEST
ncbi:diablo homolog, mitochondrial-like isoform X2 [Strongylocentrotus purpuratus]|uniref:Direct IAP-binding protein with low pI n=1 Tax=Strongylocentrotus purpuratus TaxID=7668 RepID=A0A7M7PAY5_STRPU|nr:diablo homolog, mitochondrial-like isoform X2 [Strongylocentrotus purpuratus]|eukprot:XP_011672613.1 PREDICTED: diablo homolog, mitochondrial-like [Strongylocentrotus purpuratus]